jgi:hypothetical protein
LAASVPAAMVQTTSAELPNAREGVAGGPLVRMYDGSSKPVEELGVGDRVLSYSSTKGMVAGTVVHVESRTEAAPLIRVNGSIPITKSQRVYVGGTWARAADLSRGSRLTSADRSSSVVSHVERVPFTMTTYEVRVAQEHDFFADGVLVHDATE